MRPALRIGIVGAGLAGLACALAAAQSGSSVTLYEARPSPAALPVHVDVVPNLLRELASLGVADDCVRAGFPYQGVALADLQGRTTLSIPTARLAGPRLPSSLGIRHDDLLNILAGAAQRHGVAIRWGERVERVDTQPERCLLHLARGQAAAHDLAVMAAGFSSPLLPAPLAQAMQIEELAQHWWHVLLPRPPALDRATMVIGHGAPKVLLMPVDASQAGLAALLPAAAATANPRGPDGEALKAALHSHEGPVRRMAAHLSADTPVVLRPVRSGIAPAPWYQGAVLAVGGAVHTLPPHFGQAAAQSFEDAVVLGELLRTATGPRDLFTRFMQRRHERARNVAAVVQQAARWDLRPDASTDLLSLLAALEPIVAQTP